MVFALKGRDLLGLDAELIYFNAWCGSSHGEAGHGEVSSPFFRDNVCHQGRNSRRWGGWIQG